jgi:hypothetical protein
MADPPMDLNQQNRWQTRWPKPTPDHTSNNSSYNILLMKKRPRANRPPSLWGGESKSAMNFLDKEDKLLGQFKFVK